MRFVLLFFSLHGSQRLRLLTLAASLARLSFKSVVPTVGERPHIFLDSLRILCGHLIFATRGEGHKALQLALDLVKPLCSTDTLFFFPHFGLASVNNYCQPLKHNVTQRSSMGLYHINHCFVHEHVASLKKIICQVCFNAMNKQHKLL